MEGHSSQFLWQLSIPLHIKHCPDKKNAAWKLPLFPLLHLGTTPITVTDTVLHCIYRNKTFSTFYIPGPSYWSLGTFGFTSHNEGTPREPRQLCKTKERTSLTWITHFLYNRAKVQRTDTTPAKHTGNTWRPRAKGCFPRLCSVHLTPLSANRKLSRRTGDCCFIISAYICRYGKSLEKILWRSYPCSNKSGMFFFNSNNVSHRKFWWCFITTPQRY